MPQQPENAGAQTEQFFTREVSGQIAERLLRDATQELKAAVAACLSARPQPDSIPVVSVTVCGERFLIPNRPSAQEYARVRTAVERIAPLLRSDVPRETVEQFRHLFAALFTWGHLVPDRDWRDQIQYSSFGESRGEWAAEYVVGVFRNFLSGEESRGGTPFLADAGNSRLCFDTTYQGMVERILCDHCGVDGAEFTAIDRMETATSLLDAYPSLKAIHHQPQQVLEAVIGFVCKGEQ